MNGELSHGLPRLVTAGNRIVVAPTSERILLRGVNRSGLEYSEPDEDGFLSAAGLDRYEIRWLARQWGVNIIRLPFNQDWVLNGRGGRTAEEYRQALDRVVDWAASYGVYTLLDLQWLDADRPFGANRQFVAPLPNPQTAGMWALLARRYAGEPAVLYDIFNEPHDRMADDPYPLWRPDGSQYPPETRRVSMADWQPWARLLIETIRAEAREALIFVSGTNWGYDLRGFPMDAPDLVYSTHVYRNKGGNWDEAFGNLAFRAPVFAGEWGGEEADVDWGLRLRRYMDERDMGWTAWSWADRPRLVTRYAPTAFGELVREGLPRH